MLKLFKNLLKKEPQIINLKIDEIDNLIKEKGYLESDLENQINPLIDNINSHINEIKIELNKLENAELRNPNIDNKSLNLMEGNRVSYIKKIENYINSLNIPENINSESMENFIIKYKETVDVMNKSTIKSFYILSQFFNDNTKKIAELIKKIDQLILKIESYLKNDPSRKALKIKDLLNQLKEISSKKNSIKSSIEKSNKQIDLTNEEIEKTLLKEKSIKSSDSFKELSLLISKKENLKENLEFNKKSIYDFFSKLEPGFKKLDYIMPQNYMIKNYLKDSVNALLDDKNFEILSLKNKLKEKIISEEIDLKDKKKENILNSLNELNKELLLKFVNEFNDLKENINLIQQKINSLNVGRNLSELDYKKEHLIQKKEKLNEEKESLKKSLSKYDSEEIINEIKIILEDLTNSKINFVDI